MSNKQRSKKVNNSNEIAMLRQPVKGQARIQLDKMTH